MTRLRSYDFMFVSNCILTLEVKIPNDFALSLFGFPLLQLTLLGHQLRREVLFFRLKNNYCWKVWKVDIQKVFFLAIQRLEKTEMNKNDNNLFNLIRWQMMYLN